MNKATKGIIIAVVIGVTTTVIANIITEKLSDNF
jgi:hypothetical protein